MVNKPTKYYKKTDGYYPKRCKLFPKTLSSAITHSTQKTFNKRGFNKLELTRDWQKIVGVDLSDKCYPIKIDSDKNGKYGGRLYVGASAKYALEIQYLEPVILERISAYYGYRIAERMILVKSTS